MKALNNEATGYSTQPGPMAWKAVPDFIQNTLTAQGCTLLESTGECPQLTHIRFRYVPFSFQGRVYYLQKWSRDEWGISPSQVIFPAEGPCPLEALNDSSLLSLLVRKAVARVYGSFPDGSPLQPSPTSTKQYASPLPLAS